jgi:2-amino-4-hydroxy-6-hydroxymethyldihydropteridine diphosphokinase
MVEVYLGLGSNLGDRRAHLRYALGRLREHCDIKKVSSLYETEPVDCPGEKFLNAVALVETAMPPRDLLDLMLEIEAERGRVRGALSEARTLDLDLLLYGEDVIEEDGLTVPHPRLIERVFVLVPLAEVSRDLIHPAVGTSISELARTISDKQTVDRVEQVWWKP